MNVTAVKVSDWDKDGTIVKVSNVTFDDGREIPGYDLPPGIEEGKPLPDGWEIATAKSGKFYIKARKPGGGFGGGAPAAFRNTKEGQAVEQASIQASVALAEAIKTLSLRVEPPKWDEVLRVADSYLVWLHQASGTKPLPGAGKDGAAIHQESSHSGGSVPSSPAPDEGGGKAQNRTHTEGDSASPAGAQETLGEGSSGPAGVCAHEHRSPLKPDGSPLPTGKALCLDCHTVVKA